MTTWTAIAIRDQFGALLVDSEHRVCIYDTEAEARETGDRLLGGQPFTVYHLKFRNEWSYG